MYKIAFKSSKLFYVGGAKLYQSRVRNHLCQLRKNKHHNKKLQKLVNKLGIDDLYFVVLEYCSADDVAKREQFYLDTLKPKLNVSLNRRNVGIKYGVSHRKKLSKSHKGIYPTKDNLAKRSLTMKDKLSSLTKEQKKERIRAAIEIKKRKIICVETNIVYNSIAECERLTKCDNVGLVCKGIRKHSLGFTFKYL